MECLETELPGEEKLEGSRREGVAQRDDACQQAASLESPSPAPRARSSRCWSSHPEFALASSPQARAPCPEGPPVPMPGEGG